MLAITKTETAPGAIDTYLGFEIRRLAEDSFVALPQGWSHRDIVLLEGASLPMLRKRIWAWWHRLLD